MREYTVAFDALSLEEGDRWSGTDENGKRIIVTVDRVSWWLPALVDFALLLPEPLHGWLMVAALNRGLEASMTFVQE